MPSRILAALRKPKRIATSLPELRYLVFEGMKGETGDSAYEEAVQLGFEGTEEEWLASLKGDTGANGRDGQDGAPGTPGADGEDGVSPTVQTAAITGGHRVTITDKAHPQGQSFDVMNGANGTVPAYLDRTAGVVRLVKGDAVYTSEMMQSDLDDGVPPLITAYGESGEEFFELDTRLVSASPTVGFRSKEHLLTVDSTGAYTLTDRPQGGGSSDAVLYTEQSLTPAQQAQARGNLGAGTYSKPNGGIPASDLASGVIPVVPQMATQADMSDWTSGKTVDAATLKTDYQYTLNALVEVGEDVESLRLNKAGKTEIPTKTSDLTNDSGYQTAQDVQTAIAAAAELPSVTASDNGKFLRVVSGAWAAETVQTWQGGSY